MRYELAEADQEGQIVVTLHESEDNGLCVRSVDVFTTPMKVRLSSQSYKTVDAVFHQEVAGLMRRICESATLAKQIINAPDFSMRFRGLIIRGYTLLVHTMENGLRQFIVRLKRGIGNALALFKTWDVKETALSISPNGPGENVNSQRLFDEMLAHIYLPLVNLNSFLRQAIEGRTDNRRPELLNSVVQLKTKAEMLQFAFDRVISEMMIEKYAVEPGGQKIDNSHVLIEDTPIAASA